MHALLTGSQHTHGHGTHAELHVVRLLGGISHSDTEKCFTHIWGRVPTPPSELPLSHRGPGPLGSLSPSVPFLPDASWVAHCLLRASDTQRPPWLRYSSHHHHPETSPQAEIFLPPPQELPVPDLQVLRPPVLILVPVTRGKVQSACWEKWGWGPGAGTSARATWGLELITLLPG